MRCRGLVLVIPLLCLPLFAQEPPVEPALEEEDELFFDEGLLFAEVPTVQSAARVEQKRTEAPASVWVITSEDIRRSGATNVPDLLRSVPGMEVFFASPGDPNVGARGINSTAASGVLVLVDGRMVYVDIFGIVVWPAMPFGLQDIDRIEVIRGPGSALFGANAFHGVVNIYTKHPGKWTGTKVTAMGGEHDTAITDLLHAGRAGKFGYRVSLGWATGDHEGDFKKEREDAYDVRRANGLLEYMPAENTTLGLDFGTVRFDDEFLTGLGTFQRHGSLPHAMLYFRNQREEGEWKAQVFWNGIQDADVENALLPNPDRTAHVRSSTWDGELQYTRKLDESHRLTVGYTFRQNDFDLQVLRKKITHRGHGVFAQDEWFLDDDKTLTTGVRFDSHSEFREVVSPRMAFVWEPWENHVFRASAGMAFRNFTAVEAFLAIPVTVNLGPFPVPLPLDPTPSFTIDSIGQDHLPPEHLTSYEISYLGRPNDWLKLEVTGFYNRYRGLIGFQSNSPELGPVFEAEDFAGQVPPGFEQFNADFYNGFLGPTLAAQGITTGGNTYITKSDPRVFGAEVAVDVLIADWLSVFGNYSFTDAYDDHFEENIRDAPVSKFNVGARMNLKNGLSATIVNHYVGKIDTGEGKAGSYNLLNVWIGYRFAVGRGTGEVALSAQNVLDHEHREYPTGDKLDRRALLTVGIEF